MGMAKRIAEFRRYQLTMLKKIELLKWEPYEEKYFFEVTDIYKLDRDAGANALPNWKWSSEGLEGHAVAFI